MPATKLSPDRSRPERCNHPGGHWTLRLPRGRQLTLGPHPKVMGVLNVTPDSFSDGGRFLEPERAVERGLEMLEAGADLLDLGAESTRPGGGVYGEGADEVPVAEELDRLLPVLEGLRGATDAPLSVDTRKGSVARQALAAGADLINDVSTLEDAALADAVADAGCPLVLMHSRGKIRDMQRDIRFRELISDILEELEEAARRAVGAGVDREQIVFDPGIGFGKTRDQNLEILARLDRFGAGGRPVLVGASRKSFIGEITGAPPPERLPGSLAAVAWAAHRGAALVRVHDVAETVAFLRVWKAAAEAGGEGG